MYQGNSPKMADGSINLDLWRLFGERAAFITKYQLTPYKLPTGNYYYYYYDDDKDYWMLNK